MSITKSDESEQAVSVHSSPPVSKNEANRAECLAAIPGKEFEEKNTMARSQASRLRSSLEIRSRLILLHGRIIELRIGERFDYGDC